MASIQSSTDTRVAKPGMSLRDRLSGYMASGLDFFETDARRKAFPNISQSMAKELMPIAENIPGIGQGLAAEDVGAAAKDKDWLGMGLAALGLVPGLGPEKKALEPVAEAGRAALTEAKSGIKAYHGSPHSFDQFDSSKISTGEGAQMFGRGHYLAESEGVAKRYRDTLSTQHDVHMDGQPLTTRQTYFGAHDALEEKDWRQAKVLDFFAKTNGTTEDRIRSLKEYYRGQPDMEAAIEQIGPRLEAKPNGSMYEVNINADPAHFLDWDKPLSEQSEHVNEALSQVVKSRDRMPAEWLGSSPGAEVNMAEVGIPGIKYLDAGSRGAAEGSRNYVVFDPKIINIVKKYGIAAAVGAGLVSPMMAEQMRRQGVVEEQS